MVKPTYLSKKAFEQLKAELHHLKVVRRPEVSKNIEAARAYGDLTENAEYDAAKEEQQYLLRHIAELEEMLAYSRPLEAENVPNDACYIGTTVTLEDVADGGREKYTLVGLPEADPRQGKLSVESPIGKGLLGKKVGDVAVIDIPAGEVRYRIISIER